MQAVVPLKRTTVITRRNEKVCSKALREETGFFSQEHRDLRVRLYIQY